MSGNTANIDETEVERFSALALKWWDAEGEFSQLHDLGPARLRFIRDRLVAHFGKPVGDTPRALEGLTVLDVGCGGGLVCEPLCRMGARVTGIDPGRDTIEAARAHARIDDLKITYQAMSVEALVQTHAVFDAVVCLEVIEHVPDAAAFLAQCGRLVRPGGVLIVSTINRTLKSYALAIVAAEYVLDWVPRGTHDWTRFVTADELREMLAAIGFGVPEFGGLVFDALGDGWRLSNDVSVNYMAMAAKPAQIAE